MSIIINLKNLKLTNNLASIKLKILNENGIKIYKEIFKIEKEKKIIKIDESFLKSNNIIVFDIVQHGKLIIKKYYNFSSENYDNYKIDDLVSLSMVKFKIKKLNLIYVINENNFLDYYYDVSPILAVRKESYQTSIYNNGNIIMLKNNMKKIFDVIKEKDIKTIYKEINLSKSEFVNILQMLVLKGCVIAYEK